MRYDGSRWVLRLLDDHDHVFEEDDFDTEEQAREAMRLLTNVLNR